MLIDQLHERNVIEKRVFSIDMDSQGSTLEIGGYKEGQNMAWVELNDNMFWSTTLDAFKVERVGEGAVPESYKTRPFMTIFDTGTSLTYLPKCKKYITLLLFSNWIYNYLTCIERQEVYQSTLTLPCTLQPHPLPFTLSTNTSLGSLVWNPPW